MSDHPVMRLVVLALALLPATASAERVAGPMKTRGVLLGDSKPAADCGTLEVWTVLRFDVSSDPSGPRGTKVDPKQLPVAVPCTELTRSAYGKSAGTAGVLVKGKTYVLELDNPRTSPKWGNVAAWAARRIDDPGASTAPAPTSAALTAPWSMSLRSQLFGVALGPLDLIELDSTGAIHHHLGDLDLGGWKVPADQVAETATLLGGADLAALHDIDARGEGYTWGLTVHSAAGDCKLSIAGQMPPAL